MVITYISYFHLVCKFFSPYKHYLVFQDNMKFMIHPSFVTERIWGLGDLFAKQCRWFAANSTWFSCEGDILSTNLNPALQCVWLFRIHLVDHHIFKLLQCKGNDLHLSLLDIYFKI